MNAETPEGRAVRTSDCRYWTPLEALKAAVRDIEAGVIDPDKLYLAIEETDGDQRFFAAGASKQEIIVLLKQHDAKVRAGG